MDSKAALIESLHEIFEDKSLLDKIESVVVPELPDIPGASDTESAAIAIAAYCANANKILQCFSTIPLLKYLLMGCAYSPVFQGILLSSLEEAKAATPHDFRIVSPVDGVTYEEEILLIAIEVTDGVTDFNGASVKIDGKPPRNMDVMDVPLQWGFEEEFASGEHSAEITAVFRPDYWLVKTVNFTVDIYEPPEP